LKAGLILKEYTHDYLSSISGSSISLIGWNNRQFRSWLLKE
jgi:hypothetical protein